jgi:alkanesulfonate monooxygenase SsuD/methylene tetrahydromethanopterin reductase-like flavin-dependent oxidoreductase (luciferase family)
MSRISSVADAPHTTSVTDQMVERLTLIGTAEEVRDRVVHLAAAGVTQVCLYLGVVEPEFQIPTLETWGRAIVPRFR